MNNSPISAELAELLEAYCLGELTAQQADRLAELVRTDDQCCRHYVRFTHMHALAERFEGADPLHEARSLEQEAAGTADPSVSGLAVARLYNYLADLGATGWGFLGDHPRLFSLLSLVAVVTSLATWIAVSRVHPGARIPDPGVPVIAAKQPEQTRSIAPATVVGNAPAPTAVARITSADGCRWLEGDDSPNVGDALAVGHSLHLTSGVIQITFDVGARVILQGPASFDIESPKSARLRLGKLTAEITSPAAHGFTILTANAKWVDQGTEFGVEVMPGGDSRVHVFKGEVDVTMNANAGGQASAPQKLLANAGARLESNAADVTLYDETGESFIRSMDQVQRDRHIVAYWRFEDHPAGKNVPNTSKNTKPGRGTVDSSFNGNDLFTFTPDTRPKFSAEVSDPFVPATGQPNHGCLDNTHKPRGKFPTRDVYTWSKSSHAAPIDIQKITPAQWTIEASIKPDWIKGVQTFIGRGGKPSYPVADVPPRLAFQVTAEGRIAIRFRDEADRLHEAVAAQLALAKGQWYHVAAVSTGQALLLYCDSRDGKGYQMVAKTDLPATGSTALGKLSDEAEWTVGRGIAAGRAAEWFRGWIDEVRISDIARDPAEFLFASSKKSATTAEPHEPGAESPVPSS